MALMIDPQGAEAEVDDSLVDQATAKGYKPAVEMQHPNGGTAVVPVNLYRQAEQKGYKLKALADAQNIQLPMSQTEAGLRGAAQGATLGFSDELGGVGNAIKGKLQGSNQSIGDLYAAERDAQRALNDQAQKDYGGTYTAGDLVGSLALPVGAVGSGIKGAAALGAGLGAASGLGHAQGDVQTQAEDTALGGAVGGTLGAVGGKIADYLGSKNLGDAAARKAYEATGGIKSDINKIYGADTPETVGRELLNQGVVQPFQAKSTGLMEPLQGAINKFGDYQRDLVAKNPDVQVPIEDVVKKILDRAQELKQQPGTYDQGQLLTGKAEDLISRFKDKNFTLQDALDAKNSYNAAGKYTSATDAANVEANRTLRRAFEDSIDDSLGPVAQDYEAKRDATKRLYDAQRAVTQNMERTQGKKPIGLTDTILGSSVGGGALAGGLGPAAPIVGAAAVGVKKLTETYGSSTSAVLLNEASKLLDREGVAKGKDLLAQTVGPSLATELVNIYQGGQK